MRSTLFLSIVCGLVLLFGACKKHVISDPNDLTEVQKALVKSDNELAFNILHNLDAASNTNNILLSPPALGNTMGMLISGADGTTRSNLQQAMGLSSLSSEDINQGYHDLAARLLAIDDANISYVQGSSLWYQSGVDIKPAYTQLNQLYYTAGINSVNFQDSATSITINQWPSIYTWSNVHALNPPIGSGINLVASSAAGYRAPFTTMFNAANTELLPFDLPNGTSVHVPTMFETNLTFSHYTDNTVQIADLPYGNGKFALTVIVPKEGVSIQQLLAGMTNDKWTLWMSSLDSSNTFMLRLPKVELTNPVSLESALGSLGAAPALNSTASYTNLCGNGVKPDAILQGSYLKVDETGLNAAPSPNSVTPPPNRTLISANKPFLMAVREKSTGAILMLAEINNPFGH